MLYSMLQNNQATLVLRHHHYSSVSTRPRRLRRGRHEYLIYSFFFGGVNIDILIFFPPPAEYDTMGPGPGLVARVLWLYCMRLASSGVGGVRRVRLANIR